MNSKVNDIPNVRKLLVDDGWGEEMPVAILAAIKAMNLLFERDSSLMTSRDTNAIDNLFYLFSAIMKDLYHIDFDM